MKVFLDTNILVNFITGREGVEQASEILQMCDEGKVELYASILTMINTAYVARKGRTKENLREELLALSRMIHVLPMDESQWQSALRQDARDLEDALQYQCALAAGCDCIVTRNRRDFDFAKAAVYTPQEFLAQAGGSAL